jgi:hypothetical protein
MGALRDTECQYSSLTDAWKNNATLCGALRDSDTDGICETKRDTVGHRKIVRDTKGPMGDTEDTDTEGLQTQKNSNGRKGTLRDTEGL